MFAAMIKPVEGGGDRGFLDNICMDILSSETGSSIFGGIPKTIKRKNISHCFYWYLLVCAAMAFKATSGNGLTLDNTSHHTRNRYFSCVFFVLLWKITISYGSMPIIRRNVPIEGVVWVSPRKTGFIAVIELCYYINITSLINLRDQ